jgi:hypothetical protein
VKTLELRQVFVDKTYLKTMVNGHAFLMQQKFVRDAVG